VAVIRTAQTADLPAVLELWQRAGAEPGHTDDTGSLIKLITYDPGALLVAMDDGAVVGSVIAGWDGWRGTIYRLAVAPSHQRRGLGTQLVSTAVKRLRALGAVRLQAIVVETDPRATGFWRASAWSEQAARVRFTLG
jgi:ribosomal protein S18 acetylase RimI-like enzyme